MNTFILLITLTQNAAGDFNASFTNTQNLQQCESKAQQLKGVFIAANIPLLVNRCIKSDLQFSSFSHTSTTSDPHNFYLIKPNKNTVNISIMPDWKTCIRQHNPRQRIYCSSTRQSNLAGQPFSHK